MSVFGDKKGEPIALPVRPEALDVRGQQPNLFPFDAFEFDDPKTHASPILRMKSPWSLAADANGVQIQVSATILKSDGSTWTPATVTAEAVVGVGTPSSYQWGYLDPDGTYHDIVGQTADTMVVSPSGAYWNGLVTLRLALVVVSNGISYLDSVVLTKVYDSEALGDAAAAQAAADEKSKTWLQTSAPTIGATRPGAINGDYWVDTDDSGRTRVARGGAWVEDAAQTAADLAQAAASAAAEAASDAQVTADGKIESYWQASAPTGASEGDIWFDTDDSNKAYRWTSGTWVAARDSGIAQAISAASTAQGTADLKAQIYYQTSQPSGLGASDQGDLWVDTDDNNKLWAWTGSAWILAQDWYTANQAASGAQSAANAAQADATTSLGKLSDIASDGILTPNEKPEVVLRRDIFIAEQAGIDAQLTLYGLTTLKTTYDDAVSALTTYLATLTSPVLWSNYTGNTTVVRATFNTKFKDVFDAKIAGLNGISNAAKGLIADAMTAASNAQTNAQAYADGLTTQLKNQTDHAIIYWENADASDPATTWTTDALKTAHNGDYWKKATAKTWWRYARTGINTGSWSQVTDANTVAWLNAADTAEGKNTLFPTLAAAQASAIIGDMFLDAALLYRCAVAAASVTLANSTRLTPKSWGKLASAPSSGMIANDTYYNTVSFLFYYYSGSAWTAGSDIGAANAAQVGAQNYADGLADDLQSQIDGNISSWFYSGVPSLSNAPANAWTTDAIKNNHLGDLYYDTATGYAYRFALISTVYQWQKITDSDVTEALALAAQAQETADGKNTVFLTLALAQANAEIGDLFIDAGLLYRSTQTVPANITLANSTRLTPKRYAAVANATARNALTGMIVNDTVYQLDTLQWYYYTTSWQADGESQAVARGRVFATIILVLAATGNYASELVYCAETVSYWQCGAAGSAFVDTGASKPTSNNIEGAWLCDELPEYPDDPAGTTYVQDAWATVDGWVKSAGGTPSVVDGYLVLASGDSGAYKNTADCQGKTYRIKAILTTAGGDSNLNLYYRIGAGASTLLTTVALTLNVPTIIDATIPSGSATNRISITINATSAAKIDWVYIGTALYTTPAIDNSGHGLHGTVYGPTPYYSPRGRCLSFDGINDFVSYDVTKFSHTGAFTFSCLVEGKTRTTEQYIFSRDTGGAGGRGIRCELTTSNRPAFLISYDGNGYKSISGDAGSECTEECELTFEFSPSAFMRIRKNGIIIKESTTDVPALAFYSSGQSLRLGSVLATLCFSGFIADPLLFSRILTDKEHRGLSLGLLPSLPYRLADWTRENAASDGIISNSTDKPGYREHWRELWDKAERITALPTAIGSITTAGEYKELATAANAQSVWTPTGAGTAAKAYYDSLEALRVAYFNDGTRGTGGVGCALSKFTDDVTITAMSPTLEARLTAYIAAKVALEDAISTAKANAVVAQLPRFMGNLSTDPASGNRAGDYYYNTTSKKIRAYSSGAWADASGAFTATGVGADASGTAAGLVPRFRGNLATDPTTDNRAGDYYYNTTTQTLRAYTTIWNVASDVILTQAQVDARVVAIVPTNAPKYLGIGRLAALATAAYAGYTVAADGTITAGSTITPNVGDRMVHYYATDVTTLGIYKWSSSAWALDTSSASLAGAAEDLMHLRVGGITVGDFTTWINAIGKTLWIQEITLLASGWLKSHNYAETGGYPTAGFMLDVENEVVKAYAAKFVNCAVSGDFSGNVSADDIEITAGKDLRIVAKSVTAGTDVVLASKTQPAQASFYHISTCPYRGTVYITVSATFSGVYFTSSVLYIYKNNDLIASLNCPNKRTYVLTEESVAVEPGDVIKITADESGYVAATSQIKAVAVPGYTPIGQAVETYGWWAELISDWD